MKPDQVFGLQVGTPRSRSVHRYHTEKVGPTCAYCDKPALYRAGQKGYCGLHRDEAVKHSKKLNSNQLSRKQASSLV